MVPWCHARDCTEYKRERIAEHLQRLMQVATPQLGNTPGSVLVVQRKPRSRCGIPWAGQLYIDVSLPNQVRCPGAERADNDAFFVGNAVDW